MKKLLLMVLLAASAAACGKPPPPAPSADPATQRSVSGGALVGFVTQDGAHAWLGVPYAAPPEGALRWRAPRPAPGWDGVRDATRHGSRCLQLSNRLNANEGVKPGKLIGDEDCLFLDIYAPPDAAGKTLPVMVWLHGGANVWGRASSYEGSRLARNEDVIVVIAQYRVGPLGFFSHEWLRADAAAPQDEAANFAVLDLIASLQWVRDNIGAFGGDRDRVTLFGESAGGANVASLMASPLASGLFHRAIIQSGSFDGVSQAVAETEHENASSKIVARIGVEDATALRAVDARTLFDAYADGALSFLEMPTLIADGVSLPAGPLRDAFASTESFNAVPLITGTNRDELKFFYFADPRFVKKRFFLFPTPRDPVMWDRLNHYMARMWRILAVDMPASAMADAGHDAVWAYRFDWDESGALGLSDFSTLLGAGHAVEIPFVFNRFQFFGERYDKIFFAEETAGTRDALSRAMGAHWGALARDGDPNAVAEDAVISPWPPYAADGGALMRFDSPADDAAFILSEPDSIDRLIRDLNADPQLDAEDRCIIAGEIKTWETNYSERVARAVGCAQDA